MSRDFLYDRQSIRLHGYDYTQNGLYFVTICTHNRENIFGNIVVGARRDAPDKMCDAPVGLPDKNTHMELNTNGKIVESVWKSLPKHHDVELDCFQIMPNHIHLNILLLGGLKNGLGGFLVESGGSRPAPTLGMIVGFLKSESTKQIRRLTKNPKMKIWQRNFYERIIRNEKEYDKICYYILHNPEMWNRDRNNLNCRGAA